MDTFSMPAYTGQQFILMDMIRCLKTMKPSMRGSPHSNEGKLEQSERGDCKKGKRNRAAFWSLKKE